jgi:hypothetical protein
MMQLERLMGCTAEDLIRWLPNALGIFYKSTSLKVDEQIILFNEDSQIKIIGITQVNNTIASLSIPQLHLIINFDKKLEKNKILSIMQRFDLYTRRGGG